MSVLLGAWQMGFARDAAIRIHADRVRPDTTESIVRRVLEHGATRLVERLAIEVIGTAIDRTNAAIERALAVRRPLLRVLRMLGTDRERIHAKVPADSFRGLQKISMRGLVVRMEGSVFDHAEEATLSMRAISAARAEEIASVRWPRLASLTLEVTGILDLAPLFERPPPRLTSLGLSDARHEVMVALRDSRLARRLTVLRIEGYNEGLGAWRETRGDSFPALRRLELGRPASPADATMLGRRGIQIRIVEDGGGKATGRG